MQNAASPESRAALWVALQDYSKSPGKYQVGLRQPPLLFASLRDVLQIAVGRDGNAAGQGIEETASLRDSARFFVRTAMLYPGADHYALLGLERKAESAALKDRYRLMMRLLHPDFSGPGAGAWPADAAVRVNRAYDTLSSAVQRREYDERLGQLQSATPVQGGEARRPGSLQRPSEGSTRRSRFLKLAAASALAGGALVLVSLFATGTSDTVHVVQRTRVPPVAVHAAMQSSVLSLPATPKPPTPTQLPDMQLQVPPVPTTPSAKPAERQLAIQSSSVPPQKHADAPHPSPQRFTVWPLPIAPARPAIVETNGSRVMPTVQMPQVEAALQASPVEYKPAAEVAALPVVVPTMAPGAAVTALAPVAQAAPSPGPPSKPGPTLTQAQPLLSQLLQLMEGGRGERILNLLDAEARGKPSAQALARQYDSLIDGARPVRLSHVEFKAEPGDGRLLVIGHFRLVAGEQTIGSLGKKMVVRAEFVSREGNVVITALSGGSAN